VDRIDARIQEEYTMKQLSRILAAVDFSKPARAAFEQALALARAHNAELTVVYAVPVEKTFAWRAKARMALMATLRQRAASSGVTVDISVQHGDPAGVILLHARSRRPDLVVLGTHQRTGLDRLRTGSVAERVTLRATQPVLIVPRSAGSPVTSFDNIVAAVDFGAASKAALEQALALASGRSQQLTIVHVTPGAASMSGLSDSTGAPPYLYRFGLAEYQRLLTGKAWHQLNNGIRRNISPDTQVRARVLTGTAATEIARVASEIDADLIVLGVTRRSAISRSIFGATVARVMRLSERPILAVPELTSAPTVSAPRDRERLAA
jgi:nucleotide-binding universal stress UspA family protein